MPFPVEPQLVIRHENDEFEFRFDRRRYGSVTYTWAEVRLGDAWLSLGDPWPAINWKRSELIREAQRVIAEHYHAAVGA